MFKFETILAVFFTIFSTIYVWHKLLNKKIDYNSPKLYITLFCLMYIALINYFNVSAYIRIAVVSISLMVFFRFLFRKNLQICIITPIFSQMIVMISEMIFVFIISAIFNMNSQEIINTQFAQLFSNFTISLICCVIIQFRFIIKFYSILLKITDKISKNQLLVFSSISIVIANILVGILYYTIEFKYLLIFNTCVTLFCLFIIFNLFKTKNNYIKVYDKYNTTLNSLREYEDILDKYKISNHENRNQLLTIRNMIPQTEKKIILYIDKIIKNKQKDNDKAMLEAAKIPAGGLRGLIYSKILSMKSIGIEYVLEISKTIKTVDLINFDDSLMLDVCQIIGVYIDNSIQAVKDLKQKYINIAMYLDNNYLVISISNNYKGIIDIDKLDEKGYTTKGSNHGYGLVLAKQIIDNNKKLYNKKTISKEVFSQILKIKM